MIRVIIGDWAPVYMFGEKTKYIIHKYTGQVINTKTNKEVKHSIDKDGYHKVHLYHNGKDKNFRINRLVYMSFYGDDEFNDEITEVNHKNLNRDDNSLHNLEACSTLYNIQHSITYGARKDYRGSKSVLAKYDENTAQQISELLQAGYSNTEISQLLNIPMTNVSDIKRRRTWTHVSNKYVLPEYVKHKDIELVKKIIIDIIKGERNTSIAKRYNVDHKYVSLIRKRKRHKKLFKTIEAELYEENDSTTIENTENDYYRISINV